MSDFDLLWMGKKDYDKMRQNQALQRHDTGTALKASVARAVAASPAAKKVRDASKWKKTVKQFENANHFQSARSLHAMQARNPHLTLNEQDSLAKMRSLQTKINAERKEAKKKPLKLATITKRAYNKPSTNAASLGAKIALDAAAKAKRYQRAVVNLEKGGATFHARFARD